MSEEATIPVPDWASSSGDIWARRWRDTDRGLADLAPHLLAAVEAAAREGRFKAFEIGCGPGSTTIDVADALPNAEIVACDISEALGEIAKHRLAGRAQVVVGDAEAVVADHAPVDLIFSRHGVMFFEDPARAFTSLRRAASKGASMVFSCFQSWELNPWASEVASAAAGHDLPRPGHESGAFAFADPDHVRRIFGASGWSAHEAQRVSFGYVAGEGEDAISAALSFLSELGPAARILDTLGPDEREAAVARMRGAIERYLVGGAVVFPAAAWIWTATAV